jgi:hypothetical protein
MKYEKWISETTIDTRRHPSLGPIDQALFNYKLKRTPEDLQKLGVAVREWQSAQRAPSDDTSAKVDQLKAWVEKRVSELSAEQQTVLPEIQNAATIVLKAYQAWMDDSYKADFESTFLGSADTGMRCYKYYSDKNRWEQHLITKRGAPREMAKDIDAATPTLGMTESSSRNLADNTPPRNRRVEFRPPINRHTLVHELLHWVCHESFRTKVEHHPVVKEGVTEWLTREALKEYSKGGWTDHYHTVDWGIDKKMIDAEKMKGAYLAGRGVDSMFDEVIRASSAHREDLRQRTQDPNRGQREEVAKLARQGGVGTKFSPNPTSGFSRRVLSLFKDQPDTIIREQLPDNWADWVIQKKTA